jgi:hypothetical protein
MALRRTVLLPLVESFNTDLSMREMDRRALVPPSYPSEIIHPASLIIHPHRCVKEEYFCTDGPPPLP